ncbi:hypothetical protein IW261DRAFT_1635885 [Armillaria novae-zelandiae]|uniref:Uncharacterized protein n=1 Tax=Armillaria novae-zelandiae TaxID=153914 RepID=A0AA39UFV5_9AGAR|nr:hypothetical protein IW261DRAFT_1635885 [Armillaria novae-zelandiae]
MPLRDGAAISTIKGGPGIEGNASGEGSVYGPHRKGHRKSPCVGERNKMSGARLLSDYGHTIRVPRTLRSQLIVRDKLVNDPASLESSSISTSVQLLHITLLSGKEGQCGCSDNQFQYFDPERKEDIHAWCYVNGLCSVSSIQRQMQKAIDYYNNVAEPVDLGPSLEVLDIVNSQVSNFFVDLWDSWSADAFLDISAVPRITIHASRNEIFGPRNLTWFRSLNISPVLGGNDVKQRKNNIKLEDTEAFGEMTGLDILMRLPMLSVRGKLLAWKFNATSSRFFFYPIPISTLMIILVQWRKGFREDDPGTAEAAEYKAEEAAVQYFKREHVRDSGAQQISPQLLDVSNGVPWVTMTVSGKNLFGPHIMNGFLALLTPSKSAAAFTHLYMYLEPETNSEPSSRVQAIQDIWAPLNAALTRVLWWDAGYPSEVVGVALSDELGACTLIVLLKHIIVIEHLRYITGVPGAVEVRVPPFNRMRTLAIMILRAILLENIGRSSFIFATVPGTIQTALRYVSIQELRRLIEPLYFFRSHINGVSDENASKNMKWMGACLKTDFLVYPEISWSYTRNYSWLNVYLLTGSIPNS